MEKGFKNMREGIFTDPSIFLNNYPEKLVKIADRYLPYEYGLEFECAFNSDTNFYINKNQIGHNAFAEETRNIIRFVKQVSFDSAEKRFRIPSGVKGMIALYDVSQFLQNKCSINEMSGIHVHVGISSKDIALMLGHFDILGDRKKQGLKVLAMLDEVGYKGTYNSRCICQRKANAWVNIREEYSTVEIRIFSMSFDYEKLIKMVLLSTKVVDEMISEANTIY